VAYAHPARHLLRAKDLVTRATGSRSTCARSLRCALRRRRTSAASFAGRSASLRTSTLLMRG
jgi:hypothetical protein